MKRTSKGVLIASLAAIWALPLSAQPEISRGQIMASTCFTCHGTDGRSPGNVPSLYGTPPEILIRAMQDFRAGVRASTVMDRHATGYTDEEIEEIAHYLAGVGR
jgi:cytochrome subunit of sulfide dehydrogenase